MQDIYDCIIIGGGPAGLSAALYLARLDRRAVVLDTAQGRSSWHQINHNYLGFPGGIPARELRDLGRQQLQDYPHIEFLSYKAEEIKRQEDGTFLVCWQGDAIQGRTVIICTGVLDQYPHFQDWQEYVGRSLFWCLVCDGYGAKGQRVVVTGCTNSAITEIMQMTRFTPDITLLTNSHEHDIDEHHLRRLEQAGIPLVVDKISHVEGQEGYFKALTTQSGLRLELDQLFCHRSHVPQTRLARDLGMQLDPEGYILTDGEQNTSIPGAYAAGDVTLIYSHQIATAVHEGAQAALTANYYLYPPELKD